MKPLSMQNKMNDVSLIRIERHKELADTSRKNSASLKLENWRSPTLAQSRQEQTQLLSCAPASQSLYYMSFAPGSMVELRDSNVADAMERTASWVTTGTLHPEATVQPKKPPGRDPEWYRTAVAKGISGLHQLLQLARGLSTDIRERRARVREIRVLG